MATREDKPLVLLVDSGNVLYRGALLELVAGAARVWLLDGRAPSWEQPHIEGHTRVDTLDPAALIEAARALPGSLRPAGVLCWDEIRMPAAAELARALGLPGGDVDLIWRCRDKHRTRQALAQAGVPSAASVAVSSLAQAREAAARLGWPAVLKPRALGASFGVSLAQAPEEVEEAYYNARDAVVARVPHFDDGVLVEEYLPGPEISCDAALLGERFVPLVLARKQLGFPPYFEEVGHVVDAGDPLLHDAGLRDVLERAHRALGFRDGITHTELRLTPSGPRVVEINCRLGGDLIPWVGHLATGVDPGAAAVAAACGLPYEPTPTRRLVAEVHFFYPTHDGTVASIDVRRDDLPPAVRLLGALAPPGRELRLPPLGHVRSRYAAAVVAAETRADCRRALDAAARAVTLRTAEGASETGRVRPAA